MADLVVRLAFVAIGALLFHDAVWWKDSWFFGRPPLGGWKRQSQNAQTLYRISLGAFGFLTIFAALFGSVVSPKG
jgi:hypothetical protein